MQANANISNFIFACMDVIRGMFAELANGGCLLDVSEPAYIWATIWEATIIDAEKNSIAWIFLQSFYRTLVRSLATLVTH